MLGNMHDAALRFPHLSRRGFVLAGGAALTAFRAFPETPGCTLTSEQEEGPYYIDDETLRRDITEARPGVPLILDLKLVDATGCAPLLNAAVDIWHWTPFCFLLLLAGLESLPQDPYEAAKIDGASPWQAFRHITLPLLAPFIVVALIIRTIDALKAFDTIYVITQGGPGQASETINIFLYLQAFAFYNVGYASAVVVVFFAIIMLLAALLLWTRQRVRVT